MEAEFQQLNRDYDVNKAQYTALLESYQKARLGERADNAGSVRFEVVLPPTAPVAPVWPRSARSAGRHLAGRRWDSAAGVAYRLNLLKPIVSSVRTVNELTAFPVLGVVSVAFPSRQRRDFRRHLWRFSAADCVFAGGFRGWCWCLNWSGVRLTLHAIRALVKT